jgi:hypothetical protein
VIRTDEKKGNGTIVQADGCEGCGCRTLVFSTSESSRESKADS